jgi:thiol-disulfide isomerase/thioredoxin
LRRRLLPIALLGLLTTIAPGRVLAAEPGDAAPQFSLRGLDGRAVRLSEYRGKPVVLDFWATWCVPCRASMPHLDQVQERYRQHGLVVIGVSVDDAPASAVRRYVDQLGVRFRLAMADETVLDRYGPIRSIPTTLFIDRRGRIVRRVVGYVDEETLSSFASELLTR